MPVKIEKLTCRVSVTTGRKKAVLHGSPGPPKPTMHFALPSAEPHSETAQPSPGQSIVGEANHGDSGGHGQNSGASVRTADVRAVSDRVYELMTQEIALAKRRGMG